MTMPFDFAQGAEFSDDPIVPGGDNVVTEEQVVNDSDGRSKAFDFIALANRGRNEKKAEKEKAEKKEPKKLPPRRKGALVRQLEELYTTLGMAVMAFDEPCGTAIVNSATKCAESLDNLAYENDAVRRILYRILETSAWGGVIIAHSPIIMAVAVHHVPIVRVTMAKMMAKRVGDEAEKFANGGEAA